MPIETKSDVLEYAKKKGGRLARRVGDPLLAPTDEDDADLNDLFDDTLIELCALTDRLEDHTEISVTAGQAKYARPSNLQMIEKATYEEPNASGAPTIVRLEVREGDRVLMDVDAAQSDEHERPAVIGVHSGDLYLFPVPDTAGTLRVYYRQNGYYASSDPDAPTADELVSQIPIELRRSVGDYMLALWWDETGQEQLSDDMYARWNRDINNHATKKNRTRRTTRAYRPHGL